MSIIQEISSTAVPIPDPLFALKNRRPIYSKFVNDPDVIQTKLKKQFAFTKIQQYPASNCGPAYEFMFTWFPVLSSYVSQPTVTGTPIDTESVQVGPYKVDIAHCQGRRPEMEDEHIAQLLHLPQSNKDIPLFGIFDGHTGSEAAQFLKEKLSHYLIHYLEKFGLNDIGIWNALKHAFIELDYDFPTPFSGSTAIIALVIDNYLWIANLGDSRAILSTPNSAIQLSEDAKPDDPRYLRSVAKRGGYVFNHYVYGEYAPCIAIGRTFGDHHVQSAGGTSVLPHAPKITKHAILPDSTLVLACDGIWDVANTKQVSDSIQNKHTPAQIIAKAYNAQSTDNLSLLKVILNP